MYSFGGRSGQAHKLIPSPDAFLRAQTKADITLSHPLTRFQLGWIVVQRNLWILAPSAMMFSFSMSWQFGQPGHHSPSRKQLIKRRFQPSIFFRGWFLLVDQLFFVEIPELLPKLAEQFW